ncbi:hypothetical protein B0J13DRAFT_624379 [Dactylonectria estremocensis]|uniref:PD-(D/E)XK nuclease-like domain-containing protein n=1 Tax=Dactylonectria estremocensis TaxID=1079267 RepID=A0A9P9EJ57_9HYPO|nr:hypothetical protein B0J13DRAFT_624379 [Dactylonectria estremocensis]
MHKRVIEAWVDEVANLPSAPASTPSPTTEIKNKRRAENQRRDEQPNCKRKRTVALRDADPSRLNEIKSYRNNFMSSPPKRQHGPAIDIDVTPRAAIPRSNEQIQGTSFSSFVTTLRNDASSPSPSPSKRRRQSPFKRRQTMASLAQLKRPIKLINPEEMITALPNDAHSLYYNLLAVSSKSAIVPSGLQKMMSSVAMLQILPFMWQMDDHQQEQANEGTLAREYSDMLSILREAKDATQFNKGESAWNGQVHYPLLKLALSSFESVQAETITNAHIFKPFRPEDHDGWLGSASSSAASSRSSLLSDDHASAEPATTSVHKMIDFALLLLPDEPLQAAIDNALDAQKCCTINQTTYEALRTRPAPVFVETKVSTGNLASSSVQLAVWTAAWHERFRAIRTDQQVITVPVIQVYGNVWQVLFAVDNRDELLLLDQSMRIGDTSTITGLYQLRAALAVIARWMDSDFRDWITKFLSGATT